MKLIQIESIARNGIALDTETHLVQPGLLAPPLVCGSVATYDESQIDGTLLSAEETMALFRNAIEDTNTIIVGANIAFDVLVLAVAWLKRGIDLVPQIFAAFDADRIFDLQIAEALHAIAGGHLGDDPRTGRRLVNPETKKPGRYSLSMCVDLVLGRTDAKMNDEWRLRYAELEHVPIEKWPETARAYPIDDAKNTLEVALAQCGHVAQTTPQHDWWPDGCRACGTTRFGELCIAKRRHRNLHDLSSQVRAAFALHLGAAWGFRVDQSKVDIVEGYARTHRENGITPFKEAGIIRPEGTVNEAVVKGLVAKAYGSVQACAVCKGTGRVLAPNTRRIRCPDCMGRVLARPSCTRCDTTGKIVDVRHTIRCVGPDGEKTCDGTGLTLADSVPRSDTGCISTSADTLHESGEEFVMSYGDFTEDSKWLKDYVPYLRKARRATPDGRWLDIALTLHPNSMVKSGRVSYYDHIQTFPKWPGFMDKTTGQYIPSFRECIVARPGMVLSSEDFRAGELVTGAQSSRWIVGFSDLGDTLLSRDSAGNPMDVHGELAARVLGITYEDFVKHRKEKKFSDTRGASKPFLFGKPGGMGNVTIVITQRRNGPDTPHHTGSTWIEVQNERGDIELVRGYKGLRFCILMGGDGPCGRDKRIEWKGKIYSPTCAECIDRAVELDQHWRSTFREYNRYFQYVTACVENGQGITREMLDRWPHLQEVFTADQQLAPGEIMQHVSGRIRGGMTFCDAANGFFQGLLADIAKEAYWIVTRECYDRTVRVPYQLYANSIPSAYAGATSPLLGSRTIGFFHDEFLNEHPASVASDAAKRVSEIMRDVMRHYCPDYADAAEAEPTLMMAWDKRASRIEHGGVVQVWTPDHNPKTCKLCVGPPRSGVVTTP